MPTIAEAEQAPITYNPKAMRQFVPVHNAVDALAPEPVVEGPLFSHCEAAAAMLSRSPAAMRFPQPAGSPVKLFQQRVTHCQRRKESEEPPQRAFAPSVEDFGGAQVGVQPRIADVSSGRAEPRVERVASASPEVAAPPEWADWPPETEPATPQEEQQAIAEPRPKQSRLASDRTAAVVHSLYNVLFHHPWALTAAALVGVLLFVPKNLSHGLLETTAGDIKPRAAYVMADDFRQGILGEWGPGKLVLDDSGTARVEGLALLKDTVVLTNYRVDFDAKIASGAVGWVVGAQNTNNYYAYKLEALHKGKATTYRLLGFPVVDGIADREKQVTRDVPVELSEDFNRISVVFQDGRITTLINGYGVDYRPDPGYKGGGTGFLADEGESALIRFVSVNSNRDFVGYALAVGLEIIKGVQSLLQS